MKGSKWIDQAFAQLKRIDISNLPRGQFIVVVSGQDGNILTRKSFIR
jgi:nitrate reductase NapAB chaperone NapD